MGGLCARLGLRQSSGTVAILAVALCLCLVGGVLARAALAGGAAERRASVRGALAGARTKAPVPASFAGKATHVCRNLRASLSAPMAANVRRAAERIPGHATKALDTLVGNFMAAHQLPAYSRAVSRLEALGQPKAGRAAWSHFLAGFQVWVSLNEGVVRELQQGYEGYNLESRHNAWLRMKPFGTPTGTTVCLSVTD
jgi:hypothetical protein